MESRNSDIRKPLVRNSGEIFLDLFLGSSLGATWGIFHGCLVLTVIFFLDPEYAPGRAFLLLLFYFSAASFFGGSINLLGAKLSRRRRTLPSLSEKLRNCISTLLVSGFCLQLGNLMVIKLLGSGNGLGMIEIGILLTAIGCLIYGAIHVRPYLEERVTQPLTFFLLGAIGISFFLVGGLFINEQFLPKLLSLRSILGNILFLGIVGLIFALPMGKLIRVIRPTSASQRQGVNKVVVSAAGAIGFVVVAAATLTGAPQLREPGLPILGSKGILGVSKTGPPPIILIVIDTLRADHLSIYGYSRPTSPNLDRLAQDAMVYRKAISPSSWTLPAHASIFTGRYPFSHGAHFIEKEEMERVTLSNESGRVETTSPTWPLPESAHTMAELLREVGYRTAGIVSNYSFLHRAFGCQQGFEYYDDRMRQSKFFSKLAPFRALRWMNESEYAYQVHRKYRNAGEITRSAVQYLNRIGQEPFFLFLNYMEPHSPYNPPLAYRKKFPGKMSSYRGIEVEVMSGTRDLPQSHREHLVSQYDGEIAYVDAEVGRLLRELDSRGFYDRSLIIVTSDHGEFFGEHRLMGHASGLYEEVLWVPLIVKLPGSVRKGFHDQPVSTVDILPTVLKWAARGVPENLDGRILSDSTRPILSEQYRSSQLANSYGERFNRSERSIRSKNFKLIVRSDGSRELYDLAKDPEENHNLFGRMPNLVDSLSRWLSKNVESTPSPDRIPPGLDPESIERLRTLGYL